jgi:pimeloyl-ACP methyl ester carboxylesterase
MSEKSSDLKLNSDSTLLFLHGYCEASWVWDSISSALREDYSCLTLDLPGFGSGPMLPEEISIDAIAREVWKDLDRRQLHSCVLVGHSLGGYVALAMAELRPTDVKGLVLFHSTAFADTPEKKENRNKVIRFVEQHGPQLFLDSFAPGLFCEQESPKVLEFRKAIDSTSSQAILYYAKAMRNRPDRSAVFKGLGVPKMVVGGRFDPIIPPEVCQNIQDACGDAELAFLEKSAHLGMLEEPEKSLEILKNFAKKCF